MSRYIPEILRKRVAERAEFRCEYCGIFERYSYFTFHVEHIISLKHGGITVIENLAYSCPICNKNKGSDIATILDDIRIPIRFFNPRLDVWSDHFKVASSGLIMPKTDVGRSTIKILDFNHPDSIIERQILLANNLF